MDLSLTPSSGSGESITDQIAVLVPDASAPKVAQYLGMMKSIVVTRCNLAAYPTEGSEPELDHWVAAKTAAVLRADAQGYVRGRAIEGFSESFGGADDPAALSADDGAYLARWYRYFR